MRQLWIKFILVLIGFSCVERFEGEFPVSQDQFLVVDAQITDVVGDSYVVLTTSIRLNEARENPDEENVTLLSGAEVKVESQGGSTIPFFEMSLGRYLPENPDFIVLPGQTYRLLITLPNGRKIESPWEMVPEKVFIESLSFRPDTLRNITQFNTVSNVVGSRVLAQMDKNVNKEAFFQLRWNATYEAIAFLTDDPELLRCWINESRTDELIIGAINPSGFAVEPSKVQFVTPIKSLHGYYTEVRAYAITATIHQYWIQVKEQLEARGNIFDPIPFPIRGNLFNPNDDREFIIGTFRVMSSSSNSFFYQYPIQTYIDCNDPALAEQENIPLHCYDCREYPGATNVKPAFWPN